MKRSVPILDDEVPAYGGERSSTDQFYEEHAAEYFERTVVADMSRVHERFLPLVPIGGRLLDVGCGSGRDLRVFLRRGYRAMGLDASSALVQIAQTYSGAPCVIGRLEEIEYEHCFDGIWACASLLHLPKRMLLPTLGRLRRALVLGGTMYVSVQEGPGEYMAPDGRFFASYEKSEFLNAIQSANFKIAEVWYSEDVLSDRSTIRWINVIVRREDRDQI